MTTLVVASSKHGSTREIGERIAEVLRTNKGVTTVVEDPQDAPKWLASVNAVVVALPIYAGSLEKDGKAFLDTHRAELANKSLFVLVSGAGPEFDGSLRTVLEAYGPKELGYFRGALFEEKLGWFEKLMIKVAKGQYGDFRDWPAIEAWGKSLATRGAS
ncbi:MAG: flavodoxin domain-containing protein [Micrococcus sp.]|nr:flavodoxin domain-containing protein [Micrococcus sp.]